MVKWGCYKETVVESLNNDGYYRDCYGLIVSMYLGGGYLYRCKRPCHLCLNMDTNSKQEEIYKVKEKSARKI